MWFLIHQRRAQPPARCSPGEEAAQFSSAADPRWGGGSAPGPQCPCVPPSVPVCPPALLPSLLPLQVFKCPVSKSLLGRGGPNPGLPAHETGFGHSPRQGFEAGRASGAGFAPSLRQTRSQTRVGAPAALPWGHCHGPIEKQRREVI